MNSIPVLFIAFNRPEHTRKSLIALMSQNPEILYVFQDGPRIDNENDIIKCAQVRNVITELVSNVNTIVHTHFFECNRGCRDAIIFAISSVLKEYESVIVVEDDIITSSAFLSYMNIALDFYKEKKTVFSISGHSHAPNKFSVPSDYTYDVFASPRLFNSGWGTWRDRWEQVDWSMSYYDDLLVHQEEINAFNRSGDDMFTMLRDEKEGRSSAWDIQFAFAHFLNHAVSIVPCKSYTYHIGWDGSGTHCPNIHSTIGEEEKKLNQITNPRLLTNLYFDKRILNLQYNVFCRSKRPLWQKACNWLARKMGITVPFVIKKKIYA